MLFWLNNKQNQFTRETLHKKENHKNQKRRLQTPGCPQKLTDDDSLNDLREQGFLIPSDVDETIVFDCWKQQPVHHFDTIISKVLITRACNNRCAYCILDRPPPDTNTDMSPETAQAMDAFYMNIIRERNTVDGGPVIQHEGRRAFGNA
jgi:sulfatase maturation enzyme AslB (radical SAM superfamily)